MENIFKNAKFGDKFRTRDGRMAIFCCKLPASSLYRLAIDGLLYTSNFNEFGSYNPNYCDSSFDIICKWQEPINEEELERLTDEYDAKIQPTYWWENDGENLCCSASSVKEAFKAGYHKAKEE